MTEPAIVSAVHFVVGCTAVATGFGALALRKGATPHRATGAVFLIAMTLLTASGLWMSLSRGILFTVFLSGIAFHAFFTGWGAAALGRPIGRLVTRASPYVSGAIAIGALVGGAIAAHAPGGVLNDLPPAAFFVVAIVAVIICVSDIIFANAASPSEQRRVTRHAWRLGFSLFLATGIFFFGNNHVLPAELRTPPLLSAPVVAVVVWTFYHSLRARFAREVTFGDIGPEQVVSAKRAAGSVPSNFRFGRRFQKQTR